ncbi:MAG: hypothetical protein KAS32_14430 [Candidatus Peribacteraceae bacterium]|nr:hypothetical protein [Candidatus Peribacteraceae bacterium]
MSLEKTDYIGYGVVFKESDYDGFEGLYQQIIEDELYDKYPVMRVCGTNNISIVRDGVNGSYVFVGYILAYSDDNNGFDFVEFKQGIECDFNISKRLVDMFIDELGVAITPFKTMIFTHWS